MMVRIKNFLCLTNSMLLNELCYNFHFKFNWYFFLVYFFNQVIITKKKKEINSYQYIYVLIFALDINPTILKLLILGSMYYTRSLKSKLIQIVHKKERKNWFAAYFFLKSEIEKSAIQLHKKYIYVESLIKFPIWEIVFFS